MNEIITICFFKHLASSAHSHQRPGICGQYFFFTICHSSVLAVEENLPAASMRMPFASMHFEVILIDSLCEEALLATSVRSMRKGWGKKTTLQCCVPNGFPLSVPNRCARDPKFSNYNDRAASDEYVARMSIFVCAEFRQD